MFDGLFDWIWSLFARFFDWLISLLPSWLGTGWADLAAAMGPLAKYLSYLAALDVVAPIVVGAYVVRFTIRRLPIVG